jgi:hypothetical protein
MIIKQVKTKTNEEVIEEIKNGILYINGIDVLDNDVTIEIPTDGDSINNLQNIVSAAVAALAEK